MESTALKNKRIAVGLTQQQVADAADMGLQMYSKKERGLRRTTTQEGVVFARILGCTVEEITDITDPGVKRPELEEEAQS